MPIPSPYAREQERTAALASVAPALESLADEYWAIGTRLCEVVTAAHLAGFRSADETFDAFVAVGRALEAEGLVDRVESSMAKRYEAMGYQTVGHDETTDRQKAGWGLSEMTLAGVAAERSRFDRAFAAVTADTDTAERLAEAFRYSSELWKNWVYFPHVRRFHLRAAELLQSREVSQAFRVAPNGRLLFEDVALKLCRDQLTDQGYAALAVWKDWQDSPSDYGVQVSEDGQPFVTSEPPAPDGMDGSPPLVPVWDAESNTLTVGDIYKKQYPRQAKNAHAVLKAFQLGGWARRVANPVPSKVFSAVLRDLNNSLGEACPIRFHADGTGSGIIWGRVQ